jgi:hypothetical protein
VRTKEWCVEWKALSKNAIFHGEGINAHRVWLFDDTATCEVFISSVMDKRVCMEHWWNDN